MHVYPRTYICCKERESKLTARSEERSLDETLGGREREVASLLLRGLLLPAAHTFDLFRVTLQF